ncbi:MULTISPECIES: iron ABC transporter permease [unclassified Salinibacterium]|uniref:FecCD family ABC transporter permease n=1 Tax=unclassified Salinibacterium TaxID=2632331 RepID=UPI001F0DFBEB|nr:MULTISPECIES: iron ABC transporter permease [unclassified Salinibacterium]
MTTTARTPTAGASDTMEPVRGGAAARSRRMRRIVGLVASVVALLLVVVASLALGTRATPLVDVVAALAQPDPTNPLHSVVRELRVPRTVIGALVGLALAVAGCLMQGVTRNPLADPGLLGINAGASLFVVIAIALLGVTSPFGFIWFAFAGAAVTAALVYFIGTLARDGATPVTLALAGMAIAAVSTSIVTLLIITDVQTLATFRFWQVGSLAGRGIDMLGMLWPFVLVGLLLALFVGRDLTLLAFGDDVAKGLGHNAGLTRGLSAVAIVLLCGTATALAGPLVFVGLVVPHIARAVVGIDYRWMLAYSLVLGPLLVLVADVVGRLIVQPSELEVGLVIAVIGVPVLVALVRRVKGRAL